MTYCFARLRRRAFFVGVSAVATVWVPTAARAQFRAAQFHAAWDANATVSRFEPRAQSGSVNAPYDAPNSRWLAQRATGGTFRFDHPFVQITADAVLRDGDISTRATGGLSAWAATPAWKNWRISLSAVERHVPNDLAAEVKRDSALLASWIGPAKAPSWGSTTSLGIAYTRRSTGVWLRANRHMGAGASDSLSAMSVTAGLLHQLGNAALGLQFNTRSVYRQGFPAILVTLPAPGDAGPPEYDSTGTWRRWTDIGTTFGWGHGRLALDATINLRPRSGLQQQTVWGDAAGTAAISSRVAVVASWRTNTPPLPGTVNSARQAGSLGLRIAAPALWRSSMPAPIRSTARTFAVAQSGPGQYVISISVPNARTVELAGDFTTWTSVSLRQISTSRWEVRIRAAPGTHQCNIRVDGAEWVPPPGLPSIRDEFNGRVGFFVIE